MTFAYLVRVDHFLHECLILYIIISRYKNRCNYCCVELTESYAQRGQTLSVFGLEHVRHQPLPDGRALPTNVFPRRFLGDLFRVRVHRSEVCEWSGRTRRLHADRSKYLLIRSSSRQIIEVSIGDVDGYAARRRDVYT